MRHKRRYVKAVIFCFCLCLGLCANGFASSEKNNKKRKLYKLKSEIKKLEKSLASIYQRKDFERSALRKVDKLIADIEQKLRKISKQGISLDHQISQLERQKLRFSQQIVKSRREVQKELLNDFVYGKESTLRLILSSREVSKIKRGLVYQEYINQARFKKHQMIQTKIIKIDAINEVITRQQVQANLLRRQHADNKAYFSRERRNRKLILKRLVTSEKQNKVQLNRLIKDKVALGKVYKFIRKTVQVFTPPAATLATAFSKLKGKLSWPIRGKIGSRFSRQAKKGDMHKQGVLILAPPGGDVKVIAKGRVVFADWLGTFGMIMIIDHGNNYLSLYGHVRSLHKNVGDRVRSGEVIASIGSSGGIKQSALYFEIRRKGIPQNPTRWCKYWPR